MSRRLSSLLASSAAVLALLLVSACGGDSSDDGAGDPATTSSETASETSEAPADGTTIEGTEGSVTLADGKIGDKPDVQVDTPFSVKQTTVKTVIKGDGAKVAKNASVQVDYYGVNGRSGDVFDESFSRQPASFPLDGVVTGFAKAIEGQTVGSRVLVAMTPADGYGPDGAPAADIKGTDTLVFVIDILKAK